MVTDNKYEPTRANVFRRGVQNNYLIVRSVPSFENRVYGIRFHTFNRGNGKSPVDVVLLNTLYSCNTVVPMVYFSLSTDFYACPTKKTNKRLGRKCKEYLPMVTNVIQNDYVVRLRYDKSMAVTRV